MVLLQDLAVTGRLGTGHFGAVDRVSFKSNTRTAALKHGRLMLVVEEDGV